MARFLFHGSFLALWVVWLRSPEDPAHLLVVLVLLWLVPTLSLLAWLPARSRFLALLRRRLRLLDLLSVNLMVLLLLGELSLRTLAAFSESPLFVAPDAKAEARIGAWRPEPGVLVHGFPANSQGFFDEDFPAEKNEAGTRILALGDSFAVGVVPYEQNFLTLLDNLLDDPQPTEVLNYGVVGIGPREYLHLYQTEGVLERADLVLLCFFVGNDIVADRRSSFLHSNSLYLFTIPRRLWALRHEQQARLHRQRQAEAVGAAHGIRTAPTTDFSEEVFLEIERSRLRICQVDPEPKIRRAYQDAYGALADLCDAIGPRLRVLLIPDEFQVRDALYDQLVGGDELQYDRELPQQRMLAFFKERGVPCLDLLAALRRSEAGGRTYLERDTHWNRRGNRVAAEELTKWLNGQ